MGWQHGLSSNVSLWDIASVKERYRFPEHGQVLEVLFSPDGSSLTARYNDGTALIWKNTTELGSLTNALQQFSPKNDFQLSGFQAAYCP